MAVEVTMPKLGHVMEEGKVARWSKSPGDQVAKGEILFEVETDKGVLEVESVLSGVLLKVLVEAGQTMPVGTVLALMGQAGESV